MKLKCIERITTGSGKNRKTTSHTRREQSKKLPAAGISTRFGVPVQFSIPGTCWETDDDAATGVVVWNLEIHAPVKGVDYSSEFSVPVFKRPEDRMRRIDAEPGVAREVRPL